MNSAIFNKKGPLILFLTPVFVFLAIFLFYPFVINIINSFYKINGLAAGGGTLVGLKNYTDLIADNRMQIALKNTILMMVCTVVFQLGIALLLALLVDLVRIKALSNFFRTVYFFPIVISATAIGLLFNLIVLYDGGMLNQIVEGFGNTRVDWKNEKWAMITLMVPVIWQYVGFYFVILLTGINNIAEELYESADIDGATTFDKIRFITLPMLYNVLTTCLLLAATGALKVFDLPWVMFPKGMPFDLTFLTGTYMYQNAFHYNKIGYASAIAVVIVILGVILAQVINNVFKPKDY